MAPPTATEASGPDVVAAGAVVTRQVGRGREVLLVHRPKYDDWSFPKGKQDPGEHVTTTAIREVLEETGVEIRLGRPLRPQLYAVAGGRGKKVHYWTGHVVGDDDLSTYERNDEVDDLRWFPVDEARKQVTYLDDLDLLNQHLAARKRTSPLLVVRHARAKKRSRWDGPDPKRPLTRTGSQQARALVPVLRAYGVTRLLSSSSTRCVQTFKPYAKEQVVTLEESVELSEEGYAATRTNAMLTHLMDSPDPAALCSHRPVLPELFRLLGLQEEPLSPGELVVCHHRKGEVVATERHLVR